MTKRRIDGLFGGLRYSAVAKVPQRLSSKLRNDQSLRKTVEDILKGLSSAKG